MNIAEAYAIEKCQNQYMINKPSGERKFERNFKLVMEEVVSPEEIRALILSDGYTGKLQSLIKRFFGNKVLSKNFKEKDYQKVKNPFAGIVPTNDYLTVEDAKSIIKKINDALNKANPVYDVQSFIESFIRDQKKFEVIYSKDAEFWKDVYKDGKVK